VSYQNALSAATPDKSKWEMSGAEPGYYRLRSREILGYSSVDFAMNLVFQAIMMYITFFYTDIFGLRVADVTLMFLLSRFVDAFADPLMGTIAERSNPPKGKYKSWVVFGAVPFGLMAVLTYTTPDLSYGMKIVWAYVTYNLLNILYSVIINPYISLASVMTADPTQRTKLQSIRMMCAQSGGVIVALALPLVSGWLSRFLSLQSSYMTTTVFLAVIMVATLFWASTQVVERIKVTSHEDPPGFKDVIYQLTHNKYVVMMFLLFFGVYGFNTVQSSSGVYYMTYYAQRPDMVAWFSMMNVLPSVIGVPIVPWLVKRIRKKGTVLLGLAIGAAGALLLGLLPPSSIVLMLAFRGVSSFGYGILMGVLWAIITDPVEYGDLHTGRRLTAIVMTLIGLGLKFSMLLGGVIPTLILDVVDYAPGVAQQTQQSLNGIHLMSSWLPAGILIVTLIIFGLSYDLSEEKVAEIQHKIAVRDGLVEPVNDEERALVAEGEALRAARNHDHAPQRGAEPAPLSTIDPPDERETTEDSQK